MCDSEFSKFLSKFLSKVFCCRRRTAVESNIPSDFPSDIPSRPRPRRRRCSPEPRRMVVNVNQNAAPQLVEMVNVELETIHQRVQFSDPNGQVWDICWDTFRETPVVLGGRDGPHRMVDCSNANKPGWQVSVKDVIKLMGWVMDNEADNGVVLTNVVIYDSEVDVQLLLDMTVENSAMAQFDLSYPAAAPPAADINN